MTTEPTPWLPEWSRLEEPPAVIVEQVKERLRRVVGEAAVTPEQRLTELYAYALDDIGGIVGMEGTGG
jgi:hypothetical protein